VRKRYLKIHFAMDVKTGRVVSMDVTSEKVGDGRRLRRLVGDAEGRVRVRRVLADGAYDSRANFDFVAEEGIKPVIGVRSGSVPRSGGSQARKQAVIEQRKFELRAWSRIHGSGSDGGSRGLLGDKEDIRGVRHGGEVRQYGEGDNNEAFIYNIFIAQI
jgi:hypothetical protein